MQKCCFLSFNLALCVILFFKLDVGRIESKGKIQRLGNMLSLRLFFQSCKLKYAYKLYPYKKECIHIVVREESSAIPHSCSYFLLRTIL